LIVSSSNKTNKNGKTIDDYGLLSYNNQNDIGDSTFTRVFHGSEKEDSTIIDFIRRSKNKIDFCTSSGPHSLVRKIEAVKNALIVAIKERGIKYRFLTEVTAENIEYCKEMLTFSEIRHFDGIKGNFGIADDFEYVAVATLKKEQPISQTIFSNVPEFVEQQQFVFDSFWDKGKPAEQRIREIEKGIVPEVIESTSNPTKLQSKLVELLRSADKEILVIFSSVNAFHRQKSAGIIEILEEIVQTKPQVKIKILTPKADDIEDVYRQLSHKSNFSYRFMEPIIKVSILVVDRKFSIVAEIKDDTKKTIAEAMGLATYSNSTPTVLTYAVIFDAIWNQSDMYEQLQVHSRMQKEFIDAVAHELRTPLTPIIELTKYVREKIDDEGQQRLLDIVISSGKRLHTLSENILLLTKMEGHLLSISKEVFDMSSVISDVIEGFKVRLEKIYQINIQNKKKIHFELYGFDNKYMVNADQHRIAQVVFNLVDNAVNFILDKKGSISISLEKKTENGINFIIVHIKDNGEGIHPEMISRLFTKFATKSFYGTGLGLYICKQIIEMHHGRIWGKNNEHGKGATFSFSLPVTK
jgi:signal transduction histidine kinase